jgi:hypothetical protein
MSWGMVAVAAGSAIVGGISTSQANKRAKGVSNSMNDAIAYARRNPGVFGEKIDFESIDYTPLFQQDPGYGNMAGDVIAGNRRNLGANIALTSDTNDAITQDAIDRITKLYPGFADAFAQQTQNTQNFLRGDLPMEDRDRIAAQRSEAVSLGGGGGNLAQQTAADLGLARVDLMERGAAGLTNNTSLLNMIDPVARQLTPQSNFVDVGQAINSAVAENQFDAQFAAAERDAEFNASLIPDPQKAGMLNLMSARAGVQAANPQQSVLGGAFMSAAPALAGAAGNYIGAQTAAAQQAKAVSNIPQQQYVTAPPTYASAYDRAAQIPTLSGPGAAYNPATGGAYGQQGGLWSYAGAPKTPQNSWAKVY